MLSGADVVCIFKTVSHLICLRSLVWGTRSFIALKSNKNIMSISDSKELSLFFFYWSIHLVESSDIFNIQVGVSPQVYILLIFSSK